MALPYNVSKFSYVGHFDDQLFKYQNQIRTDPQSFIPVLQDRLRDFDGLMLRRDGHRPRLTKEGAPALQEAINFLKNQKPLPALVWDKNLARAAIDHTKDSLKHNIIGHIGSDGSTTATRIQRYTRSPALYAENIDYGMKNAKEVVISMLVDDGVSKRGHRKNMFNPKFKKVGSATEMFPKPFGQ